MCSNASITEILGINDNNLVILGNKKERHVIGEWLFSEILNGQGIQDVFICPS